MAPKKKNLKNIDKCEMLTRIMATGKVVGNLSCVNLFYNFLIKKMSRHKKNDKSLFR